MISVATTGKLVRKQKYYPWLIVIGCCCMQVGGIGIFLDTCGVFYTPAATALGIPVASYGRFLSFSFFGTIPAAIIAGFLMGKVDIRYLIGVNCMITAIVLMFMGYYPTMWMRYIAGFLFGFHGGFYFMIMTPILINNWFVRRKGLAMGIAMSSSGIGAAILSPLIALLIQAIGWQLAYVCTGILVMVLIMPWVVFVFRLKPEEKGLKPFGWREEDEVNEENKEGFVKAGVPQRYAFKSVSFVCVCAFIGCIAVFSTYNSHLNAFGQTIGYTALVSSTLLTAVSIGSFSEKLIMGILYDYIGIYKIIWINCGLLATGLLILGTQTSLPFLYAGAFLFGVQNSLVAVQVPLLIRELFGDRDYAKLVPYTRVGVGLFGMIGPLTISNIYTATGSYSPVWLTSLVFVALALFFVIVARANKHKHMNRWHEAGYRQKDEVLATDSSHLCSSTDVVKTMEAGQLRIRKEDAW